MVKRTPAEILHAAKHLVGKTWRSKGGYIPVQLADAVAQASRSNAANALKAFALLHEETGADDLWKWEKDKSILAIVGMMERAAARVA
jgi:hypothetical protein